MTISNFRLVAAATTLLAMLPMCAAAAVLPLDVTPQAHLGFGQIVATTTSGTVTVTPSGQRRRDGGVVLGNGFGVSAAAFVVTGDALAVYSITLPDDCTLSAGGSSMIADGFTSDPDELGNLGPSGTQTVTIGATLHVGSGQASAAYSGTYAVTLAYN